MKANACFAALTTFERRYKGPSTAKHFVNGRKLYLLARDHIEDLVMYSEREELLILPAKDYDLLADLMANHRMHVSTYSLMEDRPAADQWHFIQLYMKEMLAMVGELVGRRDPKLARDKQFPPSPEVSASPEEQPQPSE